MVLCVMGAPLEDSYWRASEVAKGNQVGTELESLGKHDKSLLHNPDTVQIFLLSSHKQVLEESQHKIRLSNLNTCTHTYIANTTYNKVKNNTH